MKVIILKRGDGEYEDYYESVEKTYIVEDDFPELSFLFDHVYGAHIQLIYKDFEEEYRRNHPKHTNMNWNRYGRNKWSKYVTENNLGFPNWLETNYMLVPVKFDEWID